ncbi:MAG TPA: hypothetical protein VFL10_15655 [Ornithinibacter sp.]|nr:hypothetical protein [Ornithinibacter sp.]
MTEGTRPGVPRRTVVAGLFAVVLPTAGCGIRLEDDAPRVPLVPTRTPVPAEPELVALTRDTATLAALASTVPGALAADLATLHRRQHTVLRSTLVADGVPATALDATPSASPTPTASPTATPGSRTRLAAAEAASAAGAAGFAGVEDDLRATVASLHAQRYAAASLLRGRPPAVPSEPVGGDRVGTLATSTAGAVYFLEVVSARSTAGQRARSDTTLAALRGLLADQQAGGARADTSLGHPLPFPVDDAADAARLARQSLTTLRTGYGEHLAPVVASDGGAGLAALARWLGTVEVEAHRWGVALEPFPGLT